MKGKNLVFSFLVERKDSIQIETLRETGEVSTLSLKWTDSCKYEVKMLETTVDLPDSIQNIRRRNAFKTEILSWTKDYYIFKSSREKSNVEIIDTMWVVK